MIIKENLRLTTVPESNRSFSVDYATDMIAKTNKTDNRTKQPILTTCRQSIASTNSQSVNRYYNPNPYEIMTNKLCQKLNSIYDELKNKKEQRHRLDIEKETYILKIKEELLERKMTYSKFEEEIQAFKSLTIDYYNNNSDDQAKELSLLELATKKDLILTLEKQINRVKDEITSEIGKIKVDSSKTYHIENDHHKSTNRYKGISEIVDNLANELHDIENNVNIESSDVKEIENSIKEIDDQINNKEYEQIEKEELFKNNVDNLRMQLMKLSKTTKYRQEGEKNIDKLASELQTRMHRFEVQLNSNYILERKIIVYEKVNKEVFELSNKIDNAQEDNEKLKIKIKAIDPNSHITLESYRFLKEQKKDTVSLNSIKTPIKSVPEGKNLGYLKKRTGSVSKLALSPNMPYSPIPVGMSTGNNFFNQGSFFDDSARKEEDAIQKEKEMEENIRNMLLISELERLKSEKNSQDDYVWELKKNLDDKISLINNQKKEINSIDSDIKIVDISLLRIQKDIAESAFDYQTQSIVIKNMEDKFHETISSFPENVRNFVSESIFLNENDTEKGIFEYPNSNFEGSMPKRRTKSTGSTFCYKLKA